MEDIRFRIRLYDLVDLTRLSEEYSLRVPASLRPGVYLVMDYFGVAEPLVITPLKALRLTKSQLILLLYTACLSESGETLNPAVLQAVREARSWVASSATREYVVQ